MNRLKKILTICILSAALILGFTLPSAANAAGGYSFAVIEVQTKRVLFESCAQTMRPMASTTKILTALAVIENAPDLDKKVTVKREYCGIEGSSIYLREGEILTLKELLYALMLRSGNDCAVALACEVSGSVKDFAKLMNKTAKNLGAKSSNFVNPHGLHDENHFTTAYDLALISAFAMQNTVFREIVSSKTKKIGEGESYRYLVNKNKMLSNYGGATGIKTGFTKKAGRCLVSSAYRNGMEVVCVVLNCGAMFEESAMLLDKSFSEYEMSPLFIADEFNMSLPVDGTDRYCPIKCSHSFYYPLRKEELCRVSVKPEYPNSITPPFKKGDEIGRLQIYLENQLLFSQKIYTIIGIKNKDYKYILKDLIKSW